MRYMQKLILREVKFNQHEVKFNQTLKNPEKRDFFEFSDVWFNLR